MRKDKKLSLTLSLSETAICGGGSPRGKLLKDCGSLRLESMVLSQVEAASHWGGCWTQTKRSTKEGER